MKQWADGTGQGVRSVRSRPVTQLRAIAKTHCALVRRAAPFRWVLGADHPVVNAFTCNLGAHSTASESVRLRSPAFRGAARRGVPLTTFAVPG